MTALRVVGLDISLTSTGVATDRWCDRIVTSSDWPTLRRLRTIRKGVGERVRGADAVVLEGLAYAAVGGKHHERSALWWLIVERLDATLDAGVGIAAIPPASLKVYATGNGRADKAEVIQAARWHFGDRVSGPDEADATWLAAAGHAALGQPVVALPVEHTRALTALTWIRPCDAAERRLQAARRALGAPR